MWRHGFLNLLLYSVACSMYKLNGCIVDIESSIWLWNSESNPGLSVYISGSSQWNISVWYSKKDYFLVYKTYKTVASQNL